MTDSWNLWLFSVANWKIFNLHNQVTKCVIFLNYRLMKLPIFSYKILKKIVNILFHKHLIKLVIIIFSNWQTNLTIFVNFWQNSDFSQDCLKNFEFHDFLLKLKAKIIFFAFFQQWIDDIIYSHNASLLFFYIFFIPNVHFSPIILTGTKNKYLVRTLQIFFKCKHIYKDH